MGQPDENYPWPWSIYQWIQGEVATAAAVPDQKSFALELASFLAHLQQCETLGAPPPGKHNFFRGGALRTYDSEAKASLVRLAGLIDTKGATELWESALKTEWSEKPVWIHGDFSAANLLVRDGRLTAVIDFGCSAVGDPACDLAICWTCLNAPARKRFRTALKIDEATWTRGKGWVIWKAMLVMSANLSSNPVVADGAAKVIAEVLD
jgi:aminoglycoside phosphotransferase (APT) family kinase protein